MVDGSEGDAGGATVLLKTVQIPEKTKLRLKLNAGPVTALSSLYCSLSCSLLRFILIGMETVRKRLKDSHKERHTIRIQFNAINSRSIWTEIL